MKKSVFFVTREKMAKILFTIFLSVLVGTVLLSIVYCIPTSVIENNIKKSAYVFEQEGSYPTVSGTYLDNYTDALILLEASYTGSENSLHNAMDVGNPMIQQYYETSNGNPCSVLVGHYCKDENYDTVMNYTRYWHGNMVLMKPLLYFFTYPEIRILNAIMQTTLLIIVMYTLFKKLNNLAVSFAFFSVMLLLNPIVNAMSLQYSSCLYISFIGILAILAIDTKYDYLVFCLIGIFTAYFDFLTYPIVPLGITASTWILVFQKQHNNETKWMKVGYFVQNIFCWAVSYIIMWAGKWCIASIVLKQNVFFNGMASVAYRMGLDSEEEFSFLNTVVLNGKVFFSANTLCIVLLFFSVCFTYFFACKKEVHTSLKKNNKKGFPVVENLMLLLICFMPFVWYFFTQNHSSIHYWMTYKDFIVSWYALFILFALNGEYVIKKS